MTQKERQAKLIAEQITRELEADSSYSNVRVLRVEDGDYDRRNSIIMGKPPLRQTRKTTKLKKEEEDVLLQRLILESSSAFSKGESGSRKFESVKKSEKGDEREGHNQKTVEVIQINDARKRGGSTKFSYNEVIQELNRQIAAGAGSRTSARRSQRFETQATGLAKSSNITNFDKVQIYEIEIRTPDVRSNTKVKRASMPRSAKRQKTEDVRSKRLTVQVLAYRLRQKRLQALAEKRIVPAGPMVAKHFSIKVPASDQQRKAIDDKKNLVGIFFACCNVENWPGFSEAYYKPVLGSMKVEVKSAMRVKETKRPELKTKEPKVPFVDDTFLPNDNSLGIKAGGQVQWVRPKRVAMIGNAGLKGKGLYGALALLRSYGKDQLNLLIEGDQQKLNQKGHYYVRLFLNGVWRYVIIDLSMPLDKDGLIKPSYSQSSDGIIQLWSALIEKAYIKAYGTYSKYFSSKMVPQDLLNELTGAPTQSFPMGAQAVSQVKKALDKGEIVACSLKGEEHVYRVLRADHSEGVTLLRAQGEKLVPPTQVEKVVVVHCQHEAFHSTIQLLHKPQFYSILKIKLEEGTRGYIEFTQPDKKLAPLNYAYSDLTVIVQGPSPKRTYCFGAQKRASFFLEAGDYTLNVLVKWAGRQTDFQVGFYGNNLPSEFHRVYYRDCPNSIVGPFEREISRGKYVRKGDYSESCYYDKESNLLLLTIRNELPEQGSIERGFQGANPELRLLNIRDETDKDRLCNSLHKIVEQLKSKMWENPVWVFILEPGESKTLVFTHPTKRLGPNSFQEEGLV